MLPSDLLLVRRRKGRIQPRYAQSSGQNLEVATRLIQAYKDHVGQKKRVLDDLVSDLEEVGYDYRFVRGLSVLLERRCVFECGVDFDPMGLRRRIFQAAERLGVPTTSQHRSRIIEHVASEMGLSVDVADEALYADLDSELILKEFNPLSGQRLIRNYNVSLTQTMLFNSTELSFTASGNWQQIFYTVKRLGLIYEVFRKEDFWVRIDGPASLFKLTRRYGTSLAKLLPAVIHNQKWRVEAKILWKYNNRVYDFEIDSGRHGEVLGRYGDLGVSFDSVVEENFASRFKALDSDWCLKREPEPIPAGRYVIIPDFSFERDGVKVFMEIVGFWTKEYLRRKIKKLKDMDVNMLIAVDEDLACEKLEKLEKSGKLNIVYYRNRVRLAPIMRHLRSAFRLVRKEQTEFVKNLPVTFEESVVNYQEFASRIGVSTEAVRKALTEKHPQDYIVLPNNLVKKEKLEEIGRKLEQVINGREKVSLSEVTKIIENEGIQDTTNVLKSLGYKIKWQGISPQTAEVSKLYNK